MSDAPQVYPLAWPAGKPRTPADQRHAAKADAPEQDASVAYGVWRVQRELDRLGAIKPIVSSDAKGPDGAGDPGVCVRFQLGGKSYAVACDRFASVTENFAAIAKHIEATRGMERHGVASMDEVLQAFAVAASADPAKDWRDVLGDLKTIAEVAAAFRRLSAERHPDKSTGSHHAMSELSRARDQALKELEGRMAKAPATADVDAEIFVFEAKPDFGAMREAEEFLDRRGFSYGSNERGSPRAILFGAHHLAQWRKLSAEERDALDGRMTGDMRRGPVTVMISRAAMARAAQAELVGK